MQYLCLVYMEEGTFDALPQREKDELVNGALDSDERLRKIGRYVASSALQSVQTATTVRVRNGRVSVIDGPFAETKEQLGGYILIEAANLDEAIDTASTIPMARLGSIEIRPVQLLQRKPPEESR